MTDRTMLVLGANAGQADLIRHMKSRGWTVAACAHVNGLPGQYLADRFEQIDIRDLEAVCALARDVDAALVYSISSDVAIAAATRASERLGLPHFYDSAFIDLVDRKDSLRSHLNAAGLSPVAYARTTGQDIPDDWSVYPCVVKPADAQGQRGVARLDTAANLTAAVADAVLLSPSGTAIIEQYLEGVEISSNVLVCDGRVVVNEISERLVHTGDLYGIPKGHLIPPVNVSTAMQDAARDLVRDVVASLGVRNGCLYFQMKITPDGPRIIEIAPRLDGCHMWRAIEAATGFDFLAATVDVLLGQTPPTLDAAAPRHLHELIFQQTPPGIAFSPADFPPPADAAYHEHRYRNGETVAPINGLMEVVGYYVRPVSEGQTKAYTAENVG